MISTSCSLGGEDTMKAGDGVVDYVVGGGGSDEINGGAGPDLVFGDHAFVAFYESESHKLRYATTTNHSCFGGNDSIDLESGDDLAFGGSYNDTMFGGSGQDIIFGDFGEYDPEIEFLPHQNYRGIINMPDFAGSDWIHGGPDDDFLFGQEYDDEIYGGTGNDDINGGHAQRFGEDSGDLIFGGSGEDVVLGDNGEILRIRVSQSGSYPWIQGSVWKTYPAPFSDSVIRNVSRCDDIDYVQGDDEIHGGPDNDCLHGGRGDDVIYGDGGDDELFGELGNDILFGGSGSDILIGDLGHCVRRFDADGRPVLLADASAADSEYVWHKDIVLEELGNITKVTKISKKVDVAALSAEEISAASFIFIANAVQEGGGKYTENNEWPTDLILFEVVPGYDDTLDAGSGGLNVLIGQRGHDSLAGGNYSDLLIGDAGKNLIPQNSDLPRIHQVYRMLSAPAGSGHETAPNSVDFGIVFTADFEVYPSCFGGIDSIDLESCDDLAFVQKTRGPNFLPCLQCPGL